MLAWSTVCNSRWVFVGVDWAKEEVKNFEVPVTPSQGLETQAKDATKKKPQPRNEKEGIVYGIIM